MAQAFISIRALPDSGVKVGALVEAEIVPAEFVERFLGSGA
jgi:hypothetical protein